MPGQLDGRVIVIAGASAGIGLATARLCAREGGRVVMLARGSERLTAAAADVDNALAIPCDISDPESVRNAFATIERECERVDALLNVAGVARIARIEAATDDDIAVVIGTNLIGPVYTTRAAIPLLREAGGGDIINVSSEITSDYLPHMVLYGASKGGLETFTRMMARELHPHDIRVTLYLAGSTAGTDFATNFASDDLERALPDWVESGYLTRVAGPGMDPQWMADAFVFVLTRPRGQVIDVLHVRSAGR